MTRTARRGKKKEPLPATPWEELSGEQSNLSRSENGDTTWEKNDLRETRKRKLEPKVLKKAKTKLKRLRGKVSSSTTFSDNIKLIDSTENVESESGNPSGSKFQVVSKRTKKKKSARQTLIDTTGTSKSNKKGLNKRKKKKTIARKRRKAVSEDKVCLLGHSDSDSSLSDQGEVVSCGESGSSEGEGGDVGEHGEGSDNGAGVEYEEEEEEEERVLKRRKVQARIKKGNRWVKAGNSNPTPSVEEGGDGNTGQGREESGSRMMKRRRPMDEESRRKRIEHRKLRRQRKKVCFNCREPGHQLGDCPLSSSSAGVCFKCGSSEHSCQQCRAKVPPGEFPYAKCFICGEMGHLTRSCPDNPCGLYPRGGGCKICGSVEHLKANCPNGKIPSGITTTTATSKFGGGLAASSVSADALDDEAGPPVSKKLKTRKTKAKIVKF